MTKSTSLKKRNLIKLPSEMQNTSAFGLMDLIPPCLRAKASSAANTSSGTKAASAPVSSQNVTSSGIKTAKAKSAKLKKGPSRSFLKKKNIAPKRLAKNSKKIGKFGKFTKSAKKGAKHGFKFNAKNATKHAGKR